MHHDRPADSPSRCRRDRRRPDLVGGLRGPRLGPPARARHGCSTEMRELGLAATEFGPVGFLAGRPAARGPSSSPATACRRSAASCRCCCTTRDHDPLPEVDAFIDGCLASGAGVVVLAAVTGVDGYDDRPVLDETRLADAARQPRPDQRPRRERAASSPPCTPTSAPWSRPAQETERVLAGSHGRALRRHRPPRSSAAPTRSAITAAHPDRVAPRAPQGRRRRPGRSRSSPASSPSATPSGPASSVRSARATSTSRRWSGRSRPPATRAGTSSSRT